MAAGVMRETRFQEFGGCGITESKTRQTDSVCAANRNTEAKTEQQQPLSESYENKKTSSKSLVSKVACFLKQGLSEQSL